MTPYLIGSGTVRYSSIRASNGKYVLVQQPNGFINLHAIEGKLIRTLPREIRTDTQPVWSRTSVEYVYTVEGNQLWCRHVITDAAELITSFSEYVSISAEVAEGDLSELGCLALCGVFTAGSNEVFIYDIFRKKKLLATPVVAFDGLKIAPDNQWILSRTSDPRDSVIDGIFLANGMKLASYNGHACPSDKGLLWCSSADPKANANAAVLIPYEDPSRITVLKRFDWRYAMHITAGSDAGYVGVYAPDGSLPYQIWELPFAGGEKLLFEWTGPYRGYDSSPKPTFGAGMLCFNRDNGVWGMALTTASPAIVDPSLKEIKIDYDSYVGNTDFIIRPQHKCPTCGSTIAGIFERKKV